VCRFGACRFGRTGLARAVLTRAVLASSPACQRHSKRNASSRLTGGVGARVSPVLVGWQALSTSPPNKPSQRLVGGGTPVPRALVQYGPWANGTQRRVHRCASPIKQIHKVTHPGHVGVAHSHRSGAKPNDKSVHASSLKQSDTPNGQRPLACACPRAHRWCTVGPTGGAPLVPQVMQRSAHRWCTVGPTDDAPFRPQVMQRSAHR
jgi:hypothetical protein